MNFDDLIYRLILSILWVILAFVIGLLLWSLYTL